MNREIIGSVGVDEIGTDTDWAYETALSFLAAALGDPPPGVTLEVIWQEHDLGSYPALAVAWEEGVEEPWKFVRRAENAIFELNNAVNWSSIRPSDFWSSDDEEDAE